MRYCARCSSGSEGSAYCTTCGSRLDGEDARAGVAAPSVTGGAPRSLATGMQRSTLLSGLAVVVAALLTGGGVWLLLRDDPVGVVPGGAAAGSGSAEDAARQSGAAGVAEAQGEAAARGPSEAGTGGTDTTGEAGAGSNGSGAGSTAPPLAVDPRGAAGTPFWTVIVTSRTEAEGGPAAADEFAQVLAANGYTPLVFHSSAHTSLRPGYWVAATGRYAASGGASALAEELKALGFEVAYPRCVGTAAECG